MMTRGEEMRLQHLSEVKTSRKRINGIWNSNDDRNGRVRKGKEREKQSNVQHRKLGVFEN